MPSSTFSFKARTAVFVAILLASAVLSEFYCRWSKQFSDFSFYYVKLLTTVNATRAVLGDSHVGVVPRIPGYAFLGQPGQQPEELLRLVHYLYDKSPPEYVIVEASPQWFGWYHWDRKPLLTAAAFPPKIFGFQPLVLSEVYSKALFDNLIAELTAVATVGSAHAEVPKPSVQEIGQVVAEWNAAASELGTRFDWSKFPEDKRRILTVSRVYDQNPVKDFEKSIAADAYRLAIEFLIERGAKVCLFRTPVSADYLATERLIEESRYEEFDRYVKALAQSLSVRFVNYSELPFEFDDSKFFNQDHMNDRTAGAVWPLVAQSCFTK